MNGRIEGLRRILEDDSMDADERMYWTDQLNAALGDWEHSQRVLAEELAADLQGRGARTS